MERVEYRPEHYVEMENRLREYLLERLHERKALGEKVIKSYKTVRTYLALLRRLLSPDPKYYPNYSEGVEKYGDIKYPLTCGDVVRIILDMYERKGYSYKTCQMVYAMFRNLFEAMGWEWTLNWDALELKEYSREAPYLTREEMAKVVKNVLKSRLFNLRDKAVIVLVSLGIRPYDIVSLKAGNLTVDRQRNVVIISYTPCKRGAPGTVRALGGERAETLIKWVEYLAKRFRRNVREVISVRSDTGLPDDVPLFPARSTGRYGRNLFKGYPKRVPKPISSQMVWRITRRACQIYLPPRPPRFLKRRIVEDEKRYSGELLTPYCPYGFRRGYVTERLNPQNKDIFMPPWRLKKLIGWRSERTVLIYDKWGAREAAEEELRKDFYNVEPSETLKEG